MTSKKKVIVLGAGILGLAAASALAQRGADVTIVDRGQPVGQTSGTSFAWVNSNGKTPRAYHDLNAAGIAAHLDWQRDIPAHFRWFHQTGAFEWGARIGHEELAARVERLHRAGYAAALVSPDRVTALNPGLRVPDGPVGWFAQEGYVDVSRFAAWALLRVREAGGALRFGRGIVSIRGGDGGVSVELDDGETIAGDAIVLAGGRWSRPILSDLGYSLAAPDFFDSSSKVKSLLAFTRPVPAQLGSLIFTPDLNIRPDGGGRLVLQSRALFEVHATEHDLAPGGVIAAEFTHRLRALLPFVPEGVVQEVRVGRRSLTDDGLPAIGFIDKRIYLAVTHSGVTLAPVIGKAVADEVLEDSAREDLTPFRPERLLTRNDGSHAPDLPLHSAQ